MGHTVPTRSPEVPRTPFLRARSDYPDLDPLEPTDDNELGWWVSMTVMLGYGMFLALGHIQEWVYRIFCRAKQQEGEDARYGPLLRDFEHFYRKRLYVRTMDRFETPVSSVPGPWMQTHVQHMSTKTHHRVFDVEPTLSLNLGSYNYLGFARVNGECIDASKETIREFGISTCMPHTPWRTIVHSQLEERVATFVGKESAVVFGQGFATNSAVIPSIMGEGDLIISDSLNHSSLVSGCRRSGATITPFPHDDWDALEEIVREAITMGQPRTHRVWNRIIVLLEGIYSMEGEILDLPRALAIKRKYKLYLYIDEAHSIGCLGRTGRGVCEHHNVDPAEIDILMGTFTKSFGSVGGYIAADSGLCNHIRHEAEGCLAPIALAPGSARMALAAFDVLARDGELLVSRVKENSNYFRRRLREMGFKVMGSQDSPVIPVMLYHGSKIARFGRECAKRRMAVVVVGYPAVPLLLARVRFCISAAHTKADLDWALEQLTEVRNITAVQYCTPIRSAEETSSATRQLLIHKQ